MSAGSGINTNDTCSSADEADSRYVLSIAFPGGTRDSHTQAR
jgi:hypothetical protein